LKLAAARKKAGPDVAWRYNASGSKNIDTAMGHALHALVAENAAQSAVHQDAWQGCWLGGYTLDIYVHVKCEFQSKPHPLK
jgi:hypothetical protein